MNTDKHGSNDRKDLTVSAVDRQNILNNPYALQEIEKAAEMKGIPFEGRRVVLKEQVAAFFEVDIRTINNYLDRYSAELRQNGYEVIRGKRLQELKLACREYSGSERDFLTKTTVLGVFDSRAFLNLAMLMTESDRARLLRQVMLDIVIDTINQRTGGGTKYINQRDEDFIVSTVSERDDTDSDNKRMGIIVKSPSRHPRNAPGIELNGSRQIGLASGLRELLDCIPEHGARHGLVVPLKKCL